MTRNSYKNLLIESAVADIKKIEVFKTPADKILDSARKGTVTDDVSEVRDAESAIAVLGRIYDAQNEDRPLIRENDDEHEAQGDSEISVDMPDHVASAKIQDIADVIDDDAGCEANPDQQDEFKTAVADEANDNHLDENFILEGDEDGELENLPEDELPEDEEEEEDDTVAADSDEGISEDDETLPEDELPEDEEDSDEVCPECGKEPCECETEDELPEDDDEAVDADSEDEELDEGCKCEDDETLPEDELPEDQVTDDDVADETDSDEEEETLPEDELPEDEESEDEVTEDADADAAADGAAPVETEDVDDSTLDEVEATGSDEILAGEGDTVPAEEIPVDGEVYNEDVDDPTVDPNAVPAEAPVEGGDAAPATEDPNAAAEAPVEGDPNAAPAEDQTADPNAQAGEGEDETDPVLDVDSQVVASDTTQESVMESLIRSFKESSDEGYMNYESDDFDSED